MNDASLSARQGSSGGTGSSGGKVRQRVELEVVGECPGFAMASSALRCVYPARDRRIQVTARMEKGKLRLPASLRDVIKPHKYKILKSTIFPATTARTGSPPHGIGRSLCS